MSAERKIVSPLQQPAEYAGDVGSVHVEVRGGAERGTLVLTPPTGEALEIKIENGAMTLSYSGPEVRIEAPQGRMEFAAQSIGIKADQTVEVHGGKEVDIHSGEDVEVRADHHVNLWGFGVNVGD
ncbi:MAG: hypothetical protein GY898_32970 [Proteobacteria bacterium]|nr:hypothetical protein [Pseudomonadota bacterium]